MPSIKRAGRKAVETKTGFESYDGPEISRRGIYRARVVSATYVVSGSAAKTEGLTFGCVLEASKNDVKDHAQFDGYFIFARVYFGDKEMMIQREQNLYAALGVKDDPAIVYEDGGDLEPGGKGAKIKTIGGKNPVGAVLNLDIKMEKYNDEDRPKVDGILICSDKAGTGPKASVPVAAAEEDEDADLMEPEEPEEGDEPEGDEEDDQTIEERRDELNGSSLADLRGLAGEYALEVKGLKKAGIIETILEHEYPADGAPMATDPEGDDEPEEPEEEDEPEEDEPDEPEEEEPDEDAAAERAEALGNLDRRALKAILATANPEITVYKSTTDDAIREAILAAEFPESETPF